MALESNRKWREASMALLSLVYLTF